MANHNPVAEQMMVALLPDHESLSTLGKPFGVDLAFDIEAAGSLSGDFLNVHAIGEKRLALYLADCSGEEIEAALNAMRARTLIDEIKTWHDPAFFLFHLNNRLSDKLLVGQYVTMVAGIIDFSTQSFTYAGAGMPPPVIVDQQSDTPQTGDASGLPLGIAKNTTYQNRTMPFRLGSRLLLHSDGVKESKNQTGDRVGLDGVIAKLQSLTGQDGSLPPGEILAALKTISMQTRDNDYSSFLCHWRQPWTGKHETQETVFSNNRGKTVLVADDEELARELLVFALTNEGYKVSEAEDGLRALEMLNQSPGRYDAILLDKNMPHKDGFDVLRDIKKNEALAKIPVIIQTGASSADEINEGIRAGAYHYLTKPFNIDVMLAIVRAAIAEKTMYAELEEETRHKESVIDHMTSGTFALQTIQEVHDITAMLALACPEPQSAVVGLVELLLNAVEHGNLGITYNEKSHLVSTGKWESEVLRRLALPENAHKYVAVEFTRSESHVAFRIKDQGAGFDWRSYMKFDPARVTHPHGRGIAMAAMMTFSDLTYLNKGNEVIARIALPKPA